ncbi:MAG: DUF1343 domain-containing protein, partial [Cyanobacteria bacterium REEB65]|nr:DUF1343 domain-containing protein [Cyanobacteria bacterium REEB65]
TKIGCNLMVVPMIGWQRDMWWDQTGLPWIQPSPAMVSPSSAEEYPGMCFFEATNVDPRVGDRPFEVLGAPWLDGDRLAAQLTALRLPGMAFTGVAVPPGEPRSRDLWPPTYGAVQTPGGSPEEPRHQGVRFIITDRDAMRPVRTALCALALIRRDYGSLLRIDAAGFDRLAGTDWVLKQLLAGVDGLTIDNRWEAALPAFDRVRRGFLLYP